MKIASALLLTLCFALIQSGMAAARGFQPNPAAGPGGVIVHPQMGGIILGFDIDPDGNEGLLSEFHTLPDGTVRAAVETFDQTTGQILAVVANSESRDDFVTLGVVGTSIGLVEREHVLGLFHVERTYSVLNPLNSNMVTGSWTPPFGRRHIITEVKRAQGTSDVAVYAIDVSHNNNPVVFTSNIGANTFGPLIPVTDRDLNFENAPVLAFDNKANRAILGHNTRSQFIVPPTIAIIDLATGAFTKFAGRGLGVINGIAVDPEDGIVCTTTSFDARVEFYNLNTMTSSSKTLPGATDSLSSGQRIEFDPINKLFLVAQPFSSTAPGTSSIQVFDTAGNFVESIDGLSFSGTTNVLPVHIALNPGQRTGFVDGPDLQVREIQNFTY